MHRIASQMLQLSRRKAETVKPFLEKADRPRAVCATKTPMGWLALADQMLHRGHDGDVRVALFRWILKTASFPCVTRVGMNCCGREKLGFCSMYAMKEVE